MQSHNDIAFKEWAVICAALTSGCQSLILRKGGIREASGAFRLEHKEFWLFPTYVHQTQAAVIDDARSFFEQSLTDRTADGLLRLSSYAVVQNVFEIGSEDALFRIADQHIWTHDTVQSRFRYRRPGLCALAVRVICDANPA